MKIGIVGAGNLGTGLGRRLGARGHAIVASFTRSPEELVKAAAMMGPTARGGTVEEAACHGDVVILATPWSVTLDLVREHADALTGKILWDSTNALLADMSGLAIGTTTSAGEEVARAAPGARVVKAIAPFAELLHSPSTAIHGRRPGVFVCGDDPGARGVVVDLIDDVGAEAVDAGPLVLARYTEPLGMLLTQLAYVQGFGPRIGSVLIRETAHALGQPG